MNEPFVVIDEKMKLLLWKIEFGSVKRILAVRDDVMEWAYWFDGKDVSSEIYELFRGALIQWEVQDHGSAGLRLTKKGKERL